MLRKASEKDVSCQIELAQRRDFKEFFDILENTIKKSKNRQLSARQFVFNVMSMLGVRHKYR